MKDTRTSTVLTAADHEHFVEYGYLLLRNAVPPQIIEPALALLNQTRTDSSDPTHTDDPITACTTDVILRAVEELFGPDYPFEPYRTTVDLPRTYTPEASATWALDAQGGAHCDDVYATLHCDGMAIGCFIFLTRVRHKGGAILLAPGSTYPYRAILQRGPTGQVIGDSPFVRLRAGNGGFAPQLHELLAEPGDVLFRHLHLGHSGSTNVADPQTRHALVSFYAPHRRLDSTGKSIDEMSTLEKSYSVTYMRHRLGSGFPTYPIASDERTRQALAEGFAARAHVETRFQGRQHRWWVDPQDYRVIRHSVSDDWVTWSPLEPIPLQAMDVRSLHLLVLSDEALLTVAGHDGTVILLTRDFETWTPAARWPEAAATSTFNTVRNSSAAIGPAIHLFAADPLDPGTILRRTGGRPADAASYGPDVGRLDPWDEPVRVAHVPLPVADVTVHPSIGEVEYVMLITTTAGDLWYVSTRDGAVYEGEPKGQVPPLSPPALLSPRMRRLGYEGPSVPSDVRVYDRARRYWLVTYRADGRVLWGSIDWDDPEPALRPLATPEAFERALQIVGLLG